jgi:uncharacterized membrane protein YkvI
MKQFLYALLVTCMVPLSGCQAIADIFKAGVWVGIVVVLVVIFLVIFLVSKTKK